MSKAYKNEMLRCAVVCQELWDLYMKTFDKFEAGEIKDQTLTSKQLTTKPEVKQTQFQCLLLLDEEVQKELLSQVIAKELSLRGLKNKCVKEKKLSDLREKFVHLTNSKSWKDAESRFPIHAQNDKLEQFISLNVKKTTTPHPFSQFCAAAVLYSTNKEQDGIDCVAEISQINHCAFVEVADITSLDPVVITSGVKNYTGGTLFVFYMDEVCFSVVLLYYA